MVSGPLGRAVGEAIMKVSMRQGDAPEWVTRQFGSRLDSASFNVTISYLITTELN